MIPSEIVESYLRKQVDGGQDGKLPQSDEPLGSYFNCAELRMDTGGHVWSQPSEDCVIEDPCHVEEGIRRNWIASRVRVSSRANLIDEALTGGRR